MRPRESRSVAAAAAIYRVAMRILPAGLRGPYGDSVAACFDDIAAEARRRGRIAVAVVTARSIADLLSRTARHGGGRPGPDGALRRPWSGLGVDARHAARRLRRHPGFALTTIVTLSLGLGSATAVFSLVHGVVLSPLPYPRPDRLISIDHAGPGVGADAGLGITFGFYRFYTQQVPGVDAWALYAWSEQTLTGRGEPVRLHGARTTPSLGDVLRVPAHRGRWFTAADGDAGAPPVVVLSDRLWRDRFSADPAIVGQSIDLNGAGHEVIGVMPAGFRFPSADAEFWVPRAIPATGVGGWNDLAVARLAPGVDAASVEREIVARYPAFRETTDDPARVAAYLDEARVTPIVRPLRESLVADVQATLWVLLATVGAVLAIAIANVLNLFLIRAEDSHREIAVRSALGAGRARHVRTFVIEASIVAGLAGAIGMAGAAAAIRAVRATVPFEVPRIHEVGLTLPVVVAAVAAALVTGLILGLAPFVGPSAPVERTRWATSSRGGRRWRDGLVAGQVALALVLLIGSGLLVRTYAHLRAIDLGFTERQALVFDIGLPESRYPARADAARFHERLLETLAPVPGVRQASAVGQCLPLVGNMCWGEALEIEGRPVAEGTIPPITGARIATPGYFAAMGIHVRGRPFTAADGRGEATVAILSEAAARAYVPDGDAIGRRVRLSTGGPWHTIVGVAADVRGRLDTDRFSRLIYLPPLDAGRDGPPPSRMTYVLRAAVPPASLGPAVRRAVEAIDPLLPVAAMRTLDDHVDRATAPAAFALALIGLAAAVALVLGAVGIYAVVAYAVSRRTAEIGVRLAIGATPAGVRRLVLREGGQVILAGAALGLAAALGLGRFVEGLLYDVSPADPATLLAVTGAMLVIGATALALPARRASRVDPAVVLRDAP